MLETIYNDFVTKMLPAIQEGLTITKDYFFDLFGRYVKYLIVMDSIGLAVSLAIFIGSIFLGKKLWKAAQDEEMQPVFMFYIFPVFFIGLAVATYTENLVKDLYIPEIRVYEELKSQIDNQHHNENK
jgi:type IV secretory pathway TrbL component